MCISPITLKRITPRGITQVVPCGKCVDCLTTRRNEWSVRLFEELKNASSAVFITLTYSDEHLPHGEKPSLSKTDLTLFIKRLRNYLSRGVTFTNKHGKIRKIAENQPKIKYFAQGEYGSNTWRPHYHAIIFGMSISQFDVIEYAWDKGFAYFGNVTKASIHYSTKYMLPMHASYDGVQPPFAMMSKGLGKSYIDKFKKYHKDNLMAEYRTLGGTVVLPRYFRDRIFTDDEKLVITVKNLHKRDIIQRDYEEKMFNESTDPFAEMHTRKIGYTERRMQQLKKSSKI